MNDWRLNWMMPAEPLGPAIKAKEPEPPKPAEPAHDWTCAQESDRPRVTLPASYLASLRCSTQEVMRNSFFAGLFADSHEYSRRQAEAWAAAQRVDDLHQEDADLAMRHGVPADVWRALPNEGRAALRKHWVPTLGVDDRGLGPGHSPLRDLIFVNA